MKIIEVSAAIIRNHGLFLATQRPEDKPYAGFWELPGGKLQENETPEQALCRELAEELGINVLEYTLLKTVRHFYAEGNFTANVHFFLVTRIEGIPCPLEDQNMRWISPNEIGELDFLPADTELLSSWSNMDFETCLGKSKE